MRKQPTTEVETSQRPFGRVLGVRMAMDRLPEEPARLTTSSPGGQIALVRSTKVRRCEEQEISLALWHGGITSRS